VKGRASRLRSSHRGDADQCAGGQKNAALTGKSSDQQRRDRGRDGRDEQQAVLDDVAKRDQRQQAGGVAKLGEGDNEAGSSFAKADCRRDQPDQRLRIVDICDDDAAGSGQKEHHRGRWGGGLGASGRVSGGERCLRQFRPRIRASAGIEAELLS
jgi:hypothetical protein